MDNYKLSASLATVAEYFKLGIQAGLIQPHAAIKWADSEIAATELPADGVIEVAWSKSTASVLDALLIVPGERDRKLAGRWLLGLIIQPAIDSEESLQIAAKRALQVARDSELGSEIYYQFDAIDDSISLARSKTYGTLEQCRVELVAALSEYSIQCPEFLSSMHL